MDTEQLAAFLSDIERYLRDGDTVRALEAVQELRGIEDDADGRTAHVYRTILYVVPITADERAIYDAHGEEAWAITQVLEGAVPASQDHGWHVEVCDNADLA